MQGNEPIYTSLDGMRDGVRKTENHVVLFNSPPHHVEDQFEARICQINVVLTVLWQTFYDFRMVFLQTIANFYANRFSKRSAGVRGRDRRDIRKSNARSSVFRCPARSRAGSMVRRPGQLATACRNSRHYHPQLRGPTPSDCHAMDVTGSTHDDGNIP